MQSFPGEACHRLRQWCVFLAHAGYYALLEAQKAHLPRSMMNWIDRVVAAGTVELSEEVVKKATIKKVVKVKSKGKPKP